MDPPDLDTTDNDDVFKFPYFKLEHYDPSCRILIETTAGMVYDGIYGETEETEVNGRIRVFATREFPWDVRLDDDKVSLFFAREIKSLRFFKDDKEEEVVVSPFTKQLTFDEFDYYRKKGLEYIYVPVVDKNFYDIVNVLERCQEMSVEILGCHIGKIRNTTLSLLVIGTKEDVYVFDLMITPKNFFESGLKKIFEDENKTKIVFDSRVLNDCLYNRCWNTKIENTYDLQIVDYTIHKRTRRSRLLHDLRSFPVIAEEYLDLPQSAFRDTEFAKTNHVIYKRPCSSDVKEIAAFTVAYFFPLKDELNAVMNEGVNKVMQMFIDAEESTEGCTKNLDELLTQLDIKS